MEKFTEALRRSIEDCGLSRYAISRKTGIAESSLSRFLRGERGLSSESIDVLMEFLGMEARPRRRPNKGRGT
jgi:transcriptional regulator with XRE-family HTH domain